MSQHNVLTKTKKSNQETKSIENKNEKFEHINSP